ncbi:MAG: hypothetical protein R3B40_20375 [Polyangiales bacterium]|nr:hypothetical protein [Myxococcales bacterium]
MALGLGLALSALAAPAAADDLADFEAARAAYDAQRFELAAQLFEDLVGGPVPRVRNAALRLESRKYLGATYLFLGRPDEARDQFRQLLDEDEAYALDPLGFPAAVQSVFAQARSEREAAQRAAEQAEAARLEEEERLRLVRLAEEQERLRQLEELARYETIVLPNSRALATVPFGMGQFRNGNRTFGATLAVGELALLAGSVGTYVALRSLLATAARCGVEPNCVLDRGDPNGSPTPDEVRFADRERRIRVSNYILTGSFAALMVIGIIEAHVNFVPERRRRRLRVQETPGDTDGGDGASDVAPISLGLRVGVGGAALNVRF